MPAYALLASALVQTPAATSNQMEWLPTTMMMVVMAVMMAAATATTGR